MKKKIIILSIASLLIIGLVILAGCKTQSGGRQTTPVNNGDDKKEAPAPGDTGFTEYPIGDPVEKEGLTIAGVYFQPVEMEPKSGPGPDEADIHIEADISASKGNKTGFGVGEFVPNLTINYKLKKVDSGEEIEGSMMPMSASDGAHYGNNIKMLGAGNYEVTFVIESPEKQGYVLHVDKETGVKGRFWKKPITVNWNLAYVQREW